MHANFRVGEFLIEPQTNTITGAEKTARIEPKVMQVLVRLAEQAGEVVLKEKLIQSVWSDTFVTDDVLTRAISELRKVFADDAKEPRFIQTIPRSGYRLIASVSEAEVKRVDDSESLSAVGDSVPDLAPQARPPGRRLMVKRLIWMVALAIPVIGGVFLYLLRYHPESTPPLPEPPLPKRMLLTGLPGTKMMPAFSPNGNQIAFAWNRNDSHGTQIYVKLVSEGEPKQLTHAGKFNFSPVWSPDGKRIAFVRVSESDTAIFIISAYGEGEHKLFSFNKSRERRISWSPDGKYLAFADSDKNQPTRGRAIFLLSPDTREKRALTSPPTGYTDEGPAFSPDSRSLAFLRADQSCSRYELYVVPVSGGEPSRLTHGHDVFWTGPAWTEDSREIIFASQLTGSNALWKVPAAGGDAQRLEAGSDDSIEPSISLQGHRLAYMKYTVDLNIYRIALPDAKKASNAPVPILVSTRIDALAQISPDGKKVAFQSDRSGGSLEIWVCDIDGANCTQMTTEGTLTSAPRWSPDGKYLVCDSVRDCKTSVYVIDLDTHEMRGLIAEPVEERMPTWSRDGQWVYFSSTRSKSTQIWKVRAEGGAPVQITQQGGDWPCESPDARFVYYDKGNDNSEIAEIWRVPIEGGEETLVSDQLKGGMFGDWAVVDKGIYFIRFNYGDNKEGAISFFDSATGRVQEIVKLGSLHIQPGGLAVSSDQRSFLYTVWEHPGGDIVVVENFR